MSRLPRAQGWPSTLLVVLIALAFRLWDLHAAGETLDEPVYAGVGGEYIQALWRLDFREAAWAGNHEHPPIAKYIYGAAGLLAPGSPLRAGRVASALMGALTCGLLVAIGARLFDRPTGVLAGLILAFLPTAVAHTKVLGLESPSMLLVTATLLAAGAAADDPGNSRSWLMAGVLAGLAVGVRLNNLLVFFPLVALAGVRYRTTVPHPGFWLLPRNLLLLPLVSGIVFVGTWPWLWTKPLPHLLMTLGHWTYDIREFFLGVYRTPPLSYYVVYFLATTPVGVLVASAAFGVTCKRAPRMAGLTMLVWLLAPFLWSFTSFKQDGMRYIVILLPALALLAAAGLRQVQGLAHLALQPRPGLPSGWRGFLHWGITALPAILLLYLFLIDLRIHPYYLDYYNELVGGPRGVYQSQLLKLAWWNEGTDEAVGYLNRVAPAGRVGLLLEPIPREPPLRRDLTLISRDQFSARWRGKLDAPRAGEYRLITISDDGVRVWVDQRLVIDNWGRHPATEDRAVVTLLPGLHDLQVEYFQDRGQAAIQLLWEPPGGAREPVPAAHLLYAEPGSGGLKRGGLWGEYFRRIDLSEPWVSRVDPQLDFDVSRAFSYWMAPPDYLLVNAPYEWRHPGAVDLTRYALVYTARAAGAPLVKVYRRAAPDP